MSQGWLGGWLCQGVLEDKGIKIKRWQILVKLEGLWTLNHLLILVFWERFQEWRHLTSNFFSRLLCSGLGWWDDSWQVEYWTSWIPWGVWFWGAGMLGKWLWWTWSLSKDDVSLLVCYDVFSFFQISKNDRNDIFAKIVPGNLIGAIRISVLVSFFWEVKAKLGVGDSQLTGDGGSIQIRWLAQFHQVSWSTWS